MLTAAELYERARDANNSGRPLRARALFQQALASTDDQDLLARIECSLAYTESELGEAPTGLRQLDVAAVREGLTRETQGLIASQRGVILMRIGDGAGALVALTAAVDALTEASSRGRAFLNRGLVHLQHGALDRAAKDFASAADVFDSVGMSASRAKAQHNLGYVTCLRGDLVEALRVMDLARPVLAPLSEASRAVGVADKAEVLLSAGMPGAAAALLAEAARAFGAARLRQSQGEAEVLLARTLEHTDPRAARRVARRAARRFARRGSETWAVRAEAVAASAALRLGSSPDAVAEAERVAAELRSRGIRSEAEPLELQCIRAAIGSGEVSAARDRLRSTPRTRRDPVAVTLLRRQALAELAIAEGRDAAALAHLRRGLTGLQEWQASFGSLELQSATSAHGRDLADLGLGLALDRSRPAVILEWSERRALASQISPVRPHRDPEIAEALGELRYLTTLDEAARAKLSGRERTLRTLIRERAWHGTGSGQLLEPARLAELQQRLRADDAAFVAHLPVRDDVWALVISGDDARAVRVGATSRIDTELAGLLADLDMAATDLPIPLQRAVSAGLSDRLEQLDAELARAVEPFAAGRRLVLVPSPQFVAIPWTMLPTWRGRAITVPRSAAAWLASGRERDDPAARPRRAGFVAGPGLTRAADEAQEAAAHWDTATVLRGSDATCTAVTALAGAATILHLAAHGRHTPDNPLFSGLHLADGFWYGYDIDQLESVPELVFLSACELGRSTATWQQEAIGMTTAWLHAGARCVVAATAAVSDEAARRISARIHAFLASGKPPAEAVALAHDEADGIPVPFVCYGSGW